MKDIEKMLQSNPALAREVAKLFKEELEMQSEVAPVAAVPAATVLTVPQMPVGSNAVEVVPAAQELPAIDSAQVAGAGHSVVADLTAVDPITPEQVNQMVDELPAEELQGEAESLEEVKKDDEKEVEELDEVIKEATELRNSLNGRIVFTESIINRVNARILTEAAKLISSSKSLTEGKK